MKTEVSDTSVAAYHGHIVPHVQDRQAQRVLNYIREHGESTIGEIADGLNMEKSTVSARQYKLREDGALMFGVRRQCRISGITCRPLKLYPAQREFEL